MRVFSNGPAGRLGPAILPVPTALAGAYQSWGTVCGNPGTDAIPAPNPEAVTQHYSYSALHKSSDGPPSTRFGIYYQPELASTPDVSVYSDNQMPVPALGPNGKPAVMANRPIFLGQDQIGQPLVTPWYYWRT